MKPLLRTIGVLALVAFFALSCLILLDIYGAAKDPEEYRLAQNFPEADLSWKSTSVLKYQLQNVGLFIVFAFATFLSVQYLRNRLGPNMVRIYFIGVLVCVVLIAAGYFQWMQTGFDH